MHKSIGVLFLTLLTASPVTLASSPCPSQFAAVPVPDNASQCRSFGDQQPASLTFHFPAPRAETITFYQQHFKLLKHQQQKGRTLLRSPEQPWRMVLSDDKHGTQVAILNPAKT